MKIRNGFVSNSSSSSFIIGLARITDLDKLKDWINKNYGENYLEKDYKEIEIKTIEEVIKDQFKYSKSKIIYNSLVNKACVNSSPSVSLDINKRKKEKFLIVNIGNDEGDDAFSYDKNIGELNYDIVDFDYFEGTQNKILKLLMEGDNDFIEDIVYQYGAERNG